MMYLIEENPIFIVAIIWFILCCTLAFIADDRKIGAGYAFLISLFLSPVVGLICVAFSKVVKDEEYKDNLMKQLVKQSELLVIVAKKYAPEAVITEEKNSPKKEEISEKERKAQEWVETTRAKEKLKGDILN